jgi:tetratricopeptide (TPR) repeat protein
MKGIALSNLGQQDNNVGHHISSLKQFYKILQKTPNDVLALTGMGLGFGYLGEYQEAKKYFDKALTIKPDSIVLQNYNTFVDRVIVKYPYTPTEKPKELAVSASTEIPSWIKPIAKWWANDQIKDSEFVGAVGFLITNKIMQLPSTESGLKSDEVIPIWIKDRAEWWADNLIEDEDFVSGIHYMIEKGIMTVNIESDLDKIHQENEQNFRSFEKYLKQISNNISKEKRYIEFPNPSADVIKKFLRDYVKWNFEQEVQSAAGKFPDPAYQIVNNVYIVHYTIFVNEQPSGLPLDHVGTFNNSLKFWEGQDLSVNNQKAMIQFSYTNKKTEANIWVTWVVRDLGAGVLGHAHLGKGVVEVALGDYSCDGSFQLYDVGTVEKIMTHELGHSIGLSHVTDPENIMYASMKPNYAYCLLN